jgi:hypothetical protein
MNMSTKTIQGYIHAYKHVSIYLSDVQNEHEAEVDGKQSRDSGGKEHPRVVPKEEPAWEKIESLSLSLKQSCA